MTDEEKAEKYAEKHAFRVPYDGSNNFYDEKDYKVSKEGFLAGLAEGRKEKWHDLRKDPNDLPKEKTMYRVIYDNPMINRPAMWYLPSLKSWEYSNLTIIAWCDLPKFEE